MKSKLSFLYVAVTMFGVSGCVANGVVATSLQSERYLSVPDIEQASRMVDWTRKTTANSTNPVTRLSGIQGDFTLTHIYGELALKAGRTYVFRENVDDRAYLEIDGVRVLSDPEYDEHTTGVFTADRDGIFKIDFYVYNLTGGGDYQLQVSTDGGTNFRDL
jgi:hypothetical protein